jgi:hypothetical protein
MNLAVSLTNKLDPKPDIVAVVYVPRSLDAPDPVR